MSPMESRSANGATWWGYGDVNDIPSGGGKVGSGGKQLHRGGGGESGGRGKMKKEGGGWRKL